MKLQLIAIFVFILIIQTYGQKQILYDLDSYKRVDFNYRSTFITPEVLIDHRKTFNTPGQPKIYGINLGGVYEDQQIVNNGNVQKTIDRLFDFNIRSGDSEGVNLLFYVNKSNRRYSGMKYFISGYEFKNGDQNQIFISSERGYAQSPEFNYKIGFGFGRLEVVDNAWLGARILQELNTNSLLNEIPDAGEMEMFFDEIGKLEGDRVRDPRLKSIYVLEHIIEYIETRNWIEKGSIMAFLTIADAYRYEAFFRRFSGRRLEFKLQPKALAFVQWGGRGASSSNFIQPGFEGNIEFEIHSNGDLNYYNSKLIGARIGYNRRDNVEPRIDEDFIYGEIYFNYNYRYILSLRSNLNFTSDLAANFIQGDSYNASLNVISRLNYNYYLSPSTQLAVSSQVQYNDYEFQIGDYQPRLTSFFSIDIIHALR